MNTLKEIFKICNEGLWYDYSKICELNKLHKYLIKDFYDTIPHERLLISLSIVDNIILKIYNNENNDIIEDIDKLREQIIYMLSFEKKTVKDEQEIN